MIHGLLVAAFGSRRSARSAVLGLRDHHASGAVTLFGLAILARVRNGDMVRLPNAAAASDVACAPAVAAACGALPMLLGSSLMAAARSEPGGLVAAVQDLEAAGMDARLLEELGPALQPGSATVVAEIAAEAPRAQNNLDAIALRVLWRSLGPTPHERRLTELLCAASRQTGTCARRAVPARRWSEAGLIDAIAAARGLARAHRREGEAKVAVLRAQAGGLSDDQRVAVERRATVLRTALQSRSMALDLAADAAEARARRGGTVVAPLPIVAQTQAGR